jgi:hypothetical protein
MISPFGPSLISRRVALAAAFVLAAGMRPAEAAGRPGLLRFEARRSGRRIGEQQTSFEGRGAGLVVRTVADFAVKLGPVTLYRYRHEAIERWDGDRLAGLDARTNQNGRMLHVSAESEAGGVRILAASGDATRAPPTAAPFSHWNREFARRPLFNPQDGRLLRQTASAAQPALVRLADGSSISGVCVRFSGDAEIEDYYDQDGVWAGLVGKLKDGSALEYRRL